MIRVQGRPVVDIVRSFAAVAAFVSGLATAATEPLGEQLMLSGTPVYSGLARANHVFGYGFRVLEPGTVDALGGRFSGSKEVVLVDDASRIMASAIVSGESARFAWANLQPAVAVETGRTYRVLIRAGEDDTTSAAWSLSTPFVRDGVEVLALEQGWSSSAAADVWSASTRASSEQNARGLVDVRFRAAGDSGPSPADPGGSPVAGNPVTPPVGGDPYPATPGVIDSFGQAAPDGDLGHGFMAVRAYYRDFPRRAGECSIEVHDRYWVRDAAGVTHPTWHPPVDPVTGCFFAHEHGDDPRSSPNYAFAEGVPFGVTHGGADDNGPMRHEDHVGHKVVVESGWGLVDGNPQNGSKPDSDPIVRTGFTCDWLSKLHQGSWSRDALANNAHEYFLNLRCTDGVQLRLKQLVTFGPPELVTNICNNPAVDGAVALSRPDQTSEAFPSGVDASSGVEVGEPLDGKREFACLKNMVYKDSLEELWKSDGVVTLPGGGFIQFSPYYVVRNPARYLDHRWGLRGASDGYVRSLDLCFDDNAAYREEVPGFCNGIPAELASLSSDARQRDPRSPMNGTRRVVHPKSVVVYTANVPGDAALIPFCTDRLGRNAVLPDEEGCASGDIEQLVSRADRRQWGWNGSDVNAITVDGQLRGAGFLAEWPRDFGNAPGIRYPN